MYIRRKHVEMLRALKEGESVRGFEFLELFIQDLVTRDGSLTEAGSLISTIEPTDNLLIASDTIKEAELYVKTGILPEEWRLDLESRGLTVEDLPLIWEAYQKASPRVMLTPYVVSFLEEVPPTGTYDDLVRMRDSGGYGQNIINALQAMRLLFISPPTGGTRTYALSGGARRIPEFTLSLTDTVFLGEEELEKLRSGRRSEELIHYGLQESDGKPTEVGRRVVEALASKERYVRPVYLGPDELEALREIKLAWEKLTDEKDAVRRVKREISGEILRLLQFRGLLTEEYRLTPEGVKALDYGTASVEGMRAVVNAYIGEPPAARWLATAKEEGLVHYWLTDKAEFFLELGRRALRFPYLTKYDVAVLTSVPRKGAVSMEELLSMVEEKVERYDRAVAEAETKGLVKVLLNEAVVLTEFGDKMKEVVEYANTAELLHTSLAITPETWRIVTVLRENEKEVNKIWKKADENRKDYYQELAKYVASKVKMDKEEVLKLMKLLRLVGLLGSKYLTEAGRKLSEVLDVKVEGS